jgi:hypothetical protein
MRVSPGPGTAWATRAGRALAGVRSPSESVRAFAGGRPSIGGRRFASIVPVALVAVVLMGAAVGVGRSEPPTSAGRADARISVAGPVATSFAGPGTASSASGAAWLAASGPIGYGLAEPAGSLPGSLSPVDLAAWSQIRADVVGSGGCWLRSDLDTWLTRAIDAFDWLGSPSACSASPGSPVKVLAILDDQTVWSARRVCPDVAFSAAYRAHHADFTLDDWGSLVRCIARRYAGRISAYEIWNEPLLSKSMFGLEDGSAGHYLDLLRVADTEIKAADPAATVIALGGSDIYAGGDQARLALMRSFTTDLVALGAARYADAISLHAYPWGRQDGAVWTSYEDELRFQERAWAKPVWITETGQRASDDGTQSEYMKAAYDLFVQAGVRQIFWFSITDQLDGDFGLRGRPIEAAMRAFALAHGSGG